MNSRWDDVRKKLKEPGSKLGVLIGINIVLFLAANIPSIFEPGFNSFETSRTHAFVVDYLYMPSDLHKLLHRPWTVITYMFMHAGFIHIIFNMLWLYWFGSLFEEYLGTKRTLTIYLLGGLAGALFFAVGYNIIPLFAPAVQGSVIVGASAGVMAIIIATATLLPHYELNLMLFGPVQLRWIAIGYIVLDFLGTLGPNAGGEMAHLGGALLGFIYIRQLQKGNDWSKPINKLFLAKQPPMRVIRGGVNDGKPAPPTEDEIDRILDKISQRGEASLTKSEKETLQRASNNDR